MVLVLVLVLASSWDAAGCFHWENQMMACSLEPCAFQAIYVQLYFSKCSRRQEIVSMLTVSGSQWTSFADTHRHTQTIICCCCLYGKEGLLSSIAPAVTSQMFPIINSIECLLPCCFLSVSLRCTEEHHSQIPALLDSDQIVLCPLHSYCDGSFEQCLQVKKNPEDLFFEKTFFIFFSIDQRHVSSKLDVFLIF